MLIFSPYGPIVQGHWTRFLERPEKTSNFNDLRVVQDVQSEGRFKSFFLEFIICFE